MRRCWPLAAVLAVLSVDTAQCVPVQTLYEGLPYSPGPPPKTSWREALAAAEVAAPSGGRGANADAMASAPAWMGYSKEKEAGVRDWVDTELEKRYYDPPARSGAAEQADPRSETVDPRRNAELLDELRQWKQSVQDDKTKSSQDKLKWSALRGKTGAATRTEQAPPPGHMRGGADGQPPQTGRPASTAAPAEEGDEPMRVSWSAEGTPLSVNGKPIEQVSPAVREALMHYWARTHPSDPVASSASPNVEPSSPTADDADARWPPPAAAPKPDTGRVSKLSCGGPKCMSKLQPSRSRGESFLQVATDMAAMSEKRRKEFWRAGDKFWADCSCGSSPELKCDRVCNCRLKKSTKDDGVIFGREPYANMYTTEYLQTGVTVGQDDDLRDIDPDEAGDYGGLDTACLGADRYCEKDDECCDDCWCDRVTGVCTCPRPGLDGKKGSPRFPAVPSKRDETDQGDQTQKEEYEPFSTRVGGSKNATKFEPNTELTCTCTAHNCNFNASCDCKRPDEWEAYRCAMQGMKGHAISLNGGQREYLQFIRPPLRCGEFTVEFWIKVDHFRTWSRILDVGDGYHRWFMISPAGGGWWQMCSIWRWSWHGHSWWGWVRTEQFEAKRWVHVAVLFGYWHVCLLIDGEYRHCRWNHWHTRNAWRYWGRWRNWIGQSQYWWDPNLTAEIDEMRIWCGYRQGYWINKYMYRRIDNTQWHLISRWGFDEDQGIWAKDSGWYRNHLFLRRHGDWENIVYGDRNANPCTDNTYQRERRAGGWGGMCTCPDGKSYPVGDNYDACRSLFCKGGSSGSCRPGGIPGHARGKGVTCCMSNVNWDNKYPKFVVSTAPVFHKVYLCPDKVPIPKPRYGIHLSGGSPWHRHAFMYFPYQLTRKLKEFTIEFWIKSPAWFHDHWMRTIDFGGGPNWHGCPSKNILHSPGLPGRRPMFFGGKHPHKGWHYRYVVAPPMKRGKWNHIALKSGNGKIAILLDGREVKSGSCEVTIPMVSGHWNFFGRSQYPWDTYIRADVDELKFWNYARSASEINLQRFVPMTGAEPGLVAYYAFEHWNHRRAVDTTANRFHAPLIGHYGRIRSRAPVMAVDI